MTDDLADRLEAAAHGFYLPGEEPSSLLWEAAAALRAAQPVLSAATAWDGARSGRSYGPPPWDNYADACEALSAAVAGVAAATPTTEPHRAGPIPPPPTEAQMEWLRQFTSRVAATPTEPEDPTLRGDT